MHARLKRSILVLSCKLLPRGCLFSNLLKDRWRASGVEGLIHATVRFRPLLGSWAHPEVCFFEASDVVAVVGYSQD